MVSIESVQRSDEPARHTESGSATEEPAAWQSVNLFNAVNCGIVLVDNRGAIVAINDFLTTILGYTRAELEGGPLSRLVPERFRHRHQTDVSRYIQHPYMRRMGSGVDVIALHKSGAELPVEIGLSPISHRGQVFTIATVIDISEYKTIEHELSRAQKDLRAIIDNLPAMIGYWDSNLRNRFGNNAYMDWFGVTPKEMYGKHIREVIGEELFAKNYPYMERALAGEAQFFERIITDPTGSARYSQASYIPDFQDGKVEGFFVLVTDITRQKQAEIALFEEKERMRVTLGSIGDAVITTDNAGCITYLNPIAEEMTGWKSEAASGLPIEEVMVIRDAMTGATMTNPVRLALQENRIVAIEANCVLVKRGDGEFTIEDSAAPIRNGEAGTIGAVIVFHDVSEVRALAIKMSHMAQHDALTDLPNRLLLHDRISQVIQFAKRTGARFAILFLDLDNFKQINDSLGHGIGDELLRGVAKRLTQCVESSDTVSRLGGDEFIILLSRVDTADHAEQVAQTLLETIAQPFEIGNERITITFSMGISIYPDDGSDADTLIRHADAAMYSAKYAGRNRCQFFSREIEATVLARHVLEREMRKALETNQFTVYYQCIMDTATDRIIGTEALARWSRFGGEFYSPTDFISLAEETGLIIPIGRSILREACRQNVQWQTAGLPPLSVSVNISAAQFRDAELVPTVETILRETGMAPEYLELEITENTLIAADEVAHSALAHLRSIGVRIALDDFGTGFSSLSHLKRFPVDTLKIDRSFVADALQNRQDATIISAIIGMGQGLGLGIIAEGVETPEQADYLRQLGCPVMQGFLFSHPLSAEHATRLLMDRGAAPMA